MLANFSIFLQKRTDLIDKIRALKFLLKVKLDNSVNFDLVVNYYEVGIKIVFEK
mgnify:CR=1 FL=1